MIKGVDYRLIKTGLKTQQECDILKSVLGQLSDGMWENSNVAECYWPYIDPVIENGEVVLHVSKDYYKGDHPNNRFLKMSEEEIKQWLAKKLKQVIKGEGLDWKRDNTEETEFLDTSWRKSQKTSTVADCYYVYEVLKGRNVAKHPEYASKMNVSDALKTLDDAKIKYVQPEDEPWESDLDESILSQPLLSEADLTQEQIEARRRRAKARRELKKYADNFFVKRCGKGPYYVKVFQQTGDLGNGWWQEGRPEPPIYKGYKTFEDFKRLYPGVCDKLLDGQTLRWDEGDGGHNRIRMILGDAIPSSLKARIDADLKGGAHESVHEPNED